MPARFVYGYARSGNPRRTPPDPLPSAHAASTKLATSPAGCPFPRKIILFPVKRAFISSIMGCVLGPFESRCA